MIIGYGNEAVVFQTGSGNAQGDSIAATQFCDRYNEKVQRWADELEVHAEWAESFHIRAPSTGRVRDAAQVRDLWTTWLAHTSTTATNSFSSNSKRQTSTSARN